MHSTLIVDYRKRPEDPSARNEKLVSDEKSRIAKGLSDCDRVQSDRAENILIPLSCAFLPRRYSRKHGGTTLARLDYDKTVLEFTNVGAAFARILSRLRARRQGGFGIRLGFAITELAKFSPGALA